MTRKQLILSGSSLLSLAVIGQACTGEDVPPKPQPIVVRAAENTRAEERPNAKPANPPAANQNGPTRSQNAADPSADGQLAAAEEGIFLTAEAFVKAYNSEDAKSVAALFTPDAEYIDEQGYGFQGRDAIEEAFAACFKANPKAQIEMTILSIRLISPGVAVEDGTTTVTSGQTTAGPLETNYTAIHVKNDGAWRTASVRESAPKGRKQHRAQLQQLAWMLGDWVDEGEDTLVVSTCKPIQGGNYLLREFKIHVAGEETIRGEQRIGWDPLTGKLKSWVFDSDGGYSEGYWHRDDQRWILKSVGVSTDGKPASCTTIYTLINDDTMTWQTVDHEAAGVRFPDSEVVTIVRRAPVPQSDKDKLTSQLP